MLIPRFASFGSAGDSGSDVPMEDALRSEDSALLDAYSGAMMRVHVRPIDT